MTLVVVLVAECGSEAFDEFLELLGEKVRMKGFNKYRAQLDNKSECGRGLGCGWGFVEKDGVFSGV